MPHLRFRYFFCCVYYKQTANIITKWIITIFFKFYFNDFFVINKISFSNVTIILDWAQINNELWTASNLTGQTSNLLKQTQVHPIRHFPPYLGSNIKSRFFSSSQNCVNIGQEWVGAVLVFSAWSVKIFVLLLRR